MDTDNDGLVNRLEFDLYHTDPYNGDSDGDELGDGDEVAMYRTDPLVNDTDGDGWQDGYEVSLSLEGTGAGQALCPDPLSADSDEDGVVDPLDQEPCDARVE